MFDTQLPFGDLRDRRDLASDLVGVYLLILTSEYCPVAQVLSSMRVLMNLKAEFEMDDQVDERSSKAGGLYWLFVCLE